MEAAPAAKVSLAARAYAHRSLLKGSRLVHLVNSIGILWLLIDIRIPDSDGFEAAMVLRRERET